MIRNWLLTAIFALSAGVLGGAQEPAPPPGQADFAAGKREFKRGDTDGAIRLLEKAIAQNGPVEAHFYLGLAYQRRHKPAKAAEHLQKYCSAEPKDYAAHIQLGLTLKDLRKGDEAVRAFTRAVELRPEIPEPYYFLGEEAYTRRDYASARTRLEKFLSLAPEHAWAAEASYMLGRAAVATARPPATENVAANTYFGRLFELKPDSPLAGDAHFVLGTLATGKVQALLPPPGQELTPEARDRIFDPYGEARAHLEKFLELSPESAQAPDAHYAMGNMAFRVGDRAEAAVRFAKFLELRPNGPQSTEVRRLLEELKSPGN